MWNTAVAVGSPPLALHLGLQELVTDAVQRFCRPLGEPVNGGAVDEGWELAAPAGPRESEIFVDSFGLEGDKSGEGGAVKG